jgi:hypothetical protein
VTRFVVSNFSASETVRPHMETRLKFPLWIEPVERRGLYGADLESGGFGPLYGASLLLGAIGLAVLWAHRSMRSAAALVLLAASCLVASMFVHAETWWARYVPQAWLLPLLVAVPSLASPMRSLRWWIGAGVVALTVVNLLVVGANVGWRQAKYAFENRSALQQMSAQPVEVYFGQFRALRRRLSEAGVEFRTLSAPPDGASGLHPFPAPGQQASWRLAR